MEKGPDGNGNGGTQYGGNGVGGITDSDGDGVKDSNDAFPHNANCQSDSDGDGICDSNDAFPNDSSLSSPDSTPPSTSVNVQGGWYNSVKDIQFSANDRRSGVSRIEFCTGPNCNPGRGRTGNSMSLSSEGVHTVRFRAVDSAGNAGSVKSRTVKIDLSAPGVTVSTPGYTGGWSSEPVSLGVNCQDQTDLSGCRPDSKRLRFVDGPGVCPGEQEGRFATDEHGRYDVEDDDGEGAETEEEGAGEGVGDVIGDTSDESGTYYVCASAQDRAGNVGFGGSSPDAVQVQVDTTDPQVSASTTSPTDDPRQPVNYEVTEQNLDSCSASGAGVSWSCSESDPDNDGTYQGTCSPGT
ncbi:MAG: OmpL47-type beta-barrel domain-containing protein, partial [Candidatus Nanohaloarchaea archaeon]